jgi:predicted nucleic acid-binding protein
MIVVSDASPILNLAIVERLGLLRDLFHDVVVPRAFESNGLKIEYHP